MRVSEVEIHYDGTVSDWYDNVTIYEWDEVKEETIFSYSQVICTDGIIE